MLVDGVLVLCFFFICTILRMVRWKTVLNFSLKIFLLREIVFVVVVLVVVPLRPCFYCRVSTY